MILLRGGVGGRGGGAKDYEAERKTSVRIVVSEPVFSFLEIAFIVSAVSHQVEFRVFFSHHVDNIL